jgi:hypothetical protein
MMAEKRKPKMSWWRAYASARHDPKVQRLPDAMFKAWFNLLCLACEHDGVLPALADTAYELRKSEDATERLLLEMQARELFDQTERGIEPHNWNGRQYKSDVSTERVKQHRQRKRNVSPNVSETPSEKTDRGEAPTGLHPPDHTPSLVAARGSREGSAHDGGSVIATLAARKRPS